ncbi:MAG: calcium-binding protein [Magnetococcales bacterium]|nr:calcium-binding protein [Magnetococcales bacterium]
MTSLTLVGADAIDGTGNTLNNTLTGNSAVNILRGGAGADRLFGMVGNDTLYGGSGADDLDGGNGADRMVGGSGDDDYVVDNPGDVVVESVGAGTDQVKSSITWTLGDNLENLTLTGSSAIQGIGNTLPNTLLGNSGTNTLRGLAGNDLLDGNAGADILSGGDGNDQLIGDSGSDTLTGGTGADQFRFIRPSEGSDTITDFNAAQGDKLAFVSPNFGSLPVRALETGRFRASTSGGASNGTQRFLFNTTTGVLKYNPDGNGSQAAVTIATLRNVSTLSASQIMIVAG